MHGGGPASGRTLLVLAVASAVTAGDAGDVGAAPASITGEVAVDRSASDDLYVEHRPASPSPALPAVWRRERARAEGERDEKRLLAIGMLRDLLAEKPGPETEADALFKLGELEWQEAERDYLARMDTYDRALETCRRSGCARPPAEPRIELGKSEAAYGELLARYPDFARIDLVAYLVGFSAREAGREAEALALFQRVVTDFPRSPVAADAWMMIGEHHFGREVWPSARDAYAEVLARPEAPTYALALFKAAWTAWRLNELDEAARLFKLSLDASCGDANARKTGMCTESLDALVTIFAEDRGYDAAAIHGFLASIGGEPYAVDVLTNVGKSYLAQSEYERAAGVHRYLVDLDPADRHAPRHARAIAEGWLAALDDAKAAGALDDLVEHYGPRSPWATAKGDAAHAKLVARELRATEELVRRAARNLHADAQARERSGTCKAAAPYIVPAAGVARCGAAVKPMFERAAAAYERYLDAFGGKRAPKAAAEVRFLRAQILYFQLGEPEAAGDEMMIVARTAPVGERHRAALEVAMAGYEAARPANASGLVPVDTKYGDALELYARLFPGDGVAALLYKNGKMFFDHAMYSEAIKRWTVVVTAYPAAPEAPAAADGILAGINSDRDYAGLEKRARALLGAPAFAGKAQQQRLTGIIAEAIGKRGDAYADAGKNTDAAATYLRLATEFPRHRLVPEKLMNAGVVLERAKQPERAADVYARLARDYPRAPEAEAAAFAAGAVYDGIAEYERAAEAFEGHLTAFPKSKRRADALYRAGRLRQGLGQPERAIAHYRRYAKEFPRASDAIDVAFNVGVVYEAAGDEGEAERAFAAFADRFAATDKRVIEAHVRAGRNAFALGQTKRAASRFDTALALWKRASGTTASAARVWAAEARYFQGELAYAEYEKVSLSVSGKAALDRALAKKLKLLADAKALYDSIAGFNEPRWVTAALYRTGSIYDGFADALVAAPIPDLPPAVKKAYVGAIEATVFQVQGLAVEQFEAGLAAAKQLQLYDENTAKIHAALQRLDPVRFPPEREARGRIRTGDRPLTTRMLETAPRP